MKSASTFVIGIHGLGNKPPRALLEKWWRLSLSEGMRRHRGMLPFFDFRLVYWADYLNHEPYDPHQKDPAHPLYIAEPYMPAAPVMETAPPEAAPTPPFKKKVKSQLTRLLLSDPFMHAFPAVTESVMKKRFREIELYYSSDAMGKAKATAQEDLRAILAEALTLYRRRRIVLIAHSMGSLIACDVLYTLDFAIDTFITIGSPLDIPLIAEKMRAERTEQVGADHKLRTPEAITGRWINLFDQRDEIASLHPLSDFFTPNSKGITPQDRTVTTDYRTPQRVNPHKVYGYLRCREMAELMHDLITENRSQTRLRLENRVSGILYRLGRWFYR